MSYNLEKTRVMFALIWMKPKPKTNYYRKIAFVDRIIFNLKMLMVIFFMFLQSRLHNLSTKSTLFKLENVVLLIGNFFSVKNSEVRKP